MKKLLLLLIAIAVLFTGCITMMSDEKLNDWALTNGYIEPENCPELVVPEREALPHPSVPIFETIDEEGIPIPITQSHLMNMIVQLFGTVEKFQYLVEIYEREYLNTGGKIMPDLTLEELKSLYEERLSTIDRARAKIEIEETTSSEEPNPYLTSSSTTSDKLTVEQFEQLLEIWKEMNE